MQNLKFKIKNDNSKLKILGFLIIFAACYVLLVSSVSAWTYGEPIVHCGRIGTPDCTRCDLLILARNVIDFIMFGATPVVATFFFVWAGIMLMLGGANPGMLSQGKAMFKNALIGVAIVMLSWLITNTVIQTFLKPNVVGVGGDWFKITCAGLGL